MTDKLGEFTGVYNEASQSEYGNAGMTRLEFVSLRRLYASSRNSLFGTAESLTTDDKKALRDLVTASIVKDGWPEPKVVTTPDLAEAAIAHACVVAEHLYKTRGPEASPTSYQSYTVKNQFDRFVETTLRRSNNDLYKNWLSPQQRQLDYKNPDVRYPTQVDAEKIHGIAKPHRYWPAQLARYLEFIRLGRVSPEELDKWHIKPEEIKKCAVPWINFREVIEQAQDVDGIAVGVAIKTGVILQQHGLSPEPIVALIVSGYNPDGPVGEHGMIPEVGIIWHKILDAARISPEMKTIYPLLANSIRDKMARINYPFSENLSQ